LHVQGQSTQIVHAVFGGHLFAAIGAKNVFDMTAVCAHVHRHVFNESQDRNAHFFEHFHAFFGIQKGDVLRGRDDHRPGHGHTLRKGQLDIASTGRHVDDQIIKLFPVGLAQQLLQRLGGHRAAPNHGFVLADQKSNGHDLHTIVFQWFHGLAVITLGATFNAHHHGLAGAINVGVQQAHFGPLCRQSQRQVHGGGAFANAALARCHGHDVFDLRQQRHPPLSRVSGDLAGHVGRDVGHARYTFGRCNQRLAQPRDLALGRVTQLHIEGHIATFD
jgi:hypothetical protein